MANKATGSAEGDATWNSCDRSGLPRPKVVGKTAASMGKEVSEAVCHADGSSASSSRAAHVGSSPAYQRSLPAMWKQDTLTDAERRWAFILVCSSCLDLVLSACILGVAIRVAIRDGGISLYALAAQVLSHMGSSATLLIHFYGALRVQPTAPADFWDVRTDAESQPRQEAVEPFPGKEMDPCSVLARHRQDLIREQVIGITMGVVLMFASGGLSVLAVFKMRFWDTWYLDHSKSDMDLGDFTRTLCWCGFSVYAAEGILRLVSARKLRRSVVWHGFVVTAVNVLFLFVLAVAASFEREWSWKAEPIASIVLAAFCLVEGIRVVFNNLDNVDVKIRLEQADTRV